MTVSTESYTVPDLVPGAMHRCEETIKRSRFIVSVARAVSPQAARAFVERIRSEHAQANHNCWAFNAAAPGSSAFIGASDDGEPKGTAGRPMLSAILGSNIGEVVVVVTRYFGGVLLGTGGLVRAYQGMTQLGLHCLPTKKREILVRYIICMNPGFDGAFQNLVRTVHAEITMSDYRFDASHEVLVPQKDAAFFESHLRELSGGEALIDRQEDEVQ